MSSSLHPQARWSSTHSLLGKALKRHFSCFLGKRKSDCYENTAGAYLHFTLTFFPRRSFRITSIIVLSRNFLERLSSQRPGQQELRRGLAQAPMCAEPGMPDLVNQDVQDYYHNGFCGRKSAIGMPIVAVQHEGTSFGSTSVRPLQWGRVPCMCNNSQSATTAGASAGCVLWTILQLG